MSVEEAVEFFAAVPKIHRRLQTLHDVGLDYVRLGQPATTLSGGEAQRVKLATELSKVATGRTLYVLDEPTTGLHFADIEKLLEVLQRLVDQGNTVLVIEHNLDVIKCADWIDRPGPRGRRGRRADRGRDARGGRRHAGLPHRRVPAPGAARWRALARRGRMSRDPRALSQFRAETDALGHFVRQASHFRATVTADGSSGFLAEPGRYHLLRLAGVPVGAPHDHRAPPEGARGRDLDVGRRPGARRARLERSPRARGTAPTRSTASRSSPRPTPPRTRLPRPA